MSQADGGNDGVPRAHLSLVEGGGSFDETHAENMAANPAKDRATTIEMSEQGSSNGRSVADSEGGRSSGGGSIQIHDQDAHLTEKYGKQMIAALRKRRELQFANPSGAIRGGGISMCLRLSYAAPSMATVPLSLVISIWVIQVRACVCAGGGRGRGRGWKV